MSADFPVIAWFLGDEDVARKRAERDLVDAVFAGASPSFNLAKFSAGDGADRAVEVARTVPMMAKYRVVVIRDMQSATVDLLDDLDESAALMAALDAVVTPMVSTLDLAGAVAANFPISFFIL